MDSILDDYSEFVTDAEYVKTDKGFFRRAKVMDGDTMLESWAPVVGDENEPAESGGYDKVDGKYERHSDE